MQKLDLPWAEEFRKLILKYQGQELTNKFLLYIDKQEKKISEAWKNESTKNKIKTRT